MALVIPDTLPSASKGEKWLFKLLRDELPDDFFVYYEANIQGFYPDFIILSPDLGLLILEAKGWNVDQILKANHQIFEIYQQGQVEKCQSPLRQGKSYLNTLVNKLKGYSILCEDEGDFQGKLGFPVGVGAVMTNMTEVESIDKNIYPILEKPQTVYKEELLEWEDLGERGLIKRLKSMFTVRFKFSGLENDQINTIRGIIHPESAVRVERALLTSAPTKVIIKRDAKIIRTLDHKQEQLARSLGSGHRIFCGVAGSGKTLILLSRAKILAGGAFNQKVLILCFNITLAAYLRSLINQDSNPLYQERIIVLHFHGWAKSVLRSLPNPNNYSEKDEYDEVIGDRLLAALERTPTQEKWDAVLVDEGHTFQPNWFKCCAAALKDRENGDLLIVSDKSQSLYPRRKFTWKSLGIKARGRVRKLHYNYRNTEEILFAAWNLVQSLPFEEEEDEVFPLVKPSAALRRGKRPILHLCDDRLTEVKEAIAQLQQLVSEGYQPQDIAIIYRYLGDYEGEPLKHLAQQLEELGLGFYWVTQDKKNYSRSNSGIRFITTKSALGLEFKAVIIIWVQQFGVGDEVEAKRELYVSMTRAQDILHLFGFGKFQVLEELKESNCFEIYRH